MATPLGLSFTHRNDVSAPLREMATGLSHLLVNMRVPENPKIGIVRASGSRPDTVVQNKFDDQSAGQYIPGLNFDGITFAGGTCNCAPPDTNGYVGLTQDVQIVNSR